MYAYIKGYPTGFGDGTIIIEANGVGYLINASNNTIGALQGKNEMVQVYTYLNVREDDMSLYGFLSKDEKELFMQLISVSGVGPKLALTFLSGMNTKELSFAIASADLKTLSKIKGVGKKTAERICVELKDKLRLFGDTDSYQPISTSSVTSGNDYNDAVTILVDLGFSKSEANAAVIAASKVESDIDKIVQIALKNINNR